LPRRYSAASRVLASTGLRAFRKSQGKLGKQEQQRAGAQMIETTNTASKILG
jgi:hypothetical protein